MTSLCMTSLWFLFIYFFKKDLTIAPNQGSQNRLLGRGPSLVHMHAISPSTLLLPPPHCPPLPPHVKVGCVDWVEEDTHIDGGDGKIEGSCKVVLALVTGYPVQAVQCILPNGGQETIKNLAEK